jgi:hypothetical protein
MRRWVLSAASAVAVAGSAVVLAPSLAQQPAPAAQKQKPPAQKPAAQTKAPAAGGLTGTWAGSVVQPGSKGYSIALTLTTGGGTTDYPELKCAGKLTRAGTAGGFTFYLETITQGGLKQGGRCIDGSITVTLAGEKLAWGWVGVHENRTVVAHSMLARK